MPRRRNNQRRRPRRRFISGPRRYYDELFTFSIPLGRTSVITVANLSGRASTGAFRPAWIRVNACTAYTPIQDERPASFTPSVIQLTLRNPASSTVAVSRPVMLGPNPRTVTLRYPRSSDWWSSQDSSIIMGSIDAVCVGPASTKTDNAFVRGLCTMRVILRQELMATNCPNLTLLEPAPIGSVPSMVSYLTPAQQAAAMSAEFEMIDQDQNM